MNDLRPGDQIIVDITCSDRAQQVLIYAVPKDGTEHEPFHIEEIGFCDKLNGIHDQRRFAESIGRFMQSNPVQQLLYGDYRLAYVSASGEPLQVSEDRRHFLVKARIWYEVMRMKETSVIIFKDVIYHPPDPAPSKKIEEVDNPYGDLEDI